ncbi:MAG: hypothetical protein HC884_05235 [Chloroflexaceae bacterium]|nr:hypothetical protein [Chloroflexaceae bacterium]
MTNVLETVYNHYRFRSRTEARWAVFFDVASVPYRYEYEGFDLDGTWYLPDFWLPEHRCWFEVKGQRPTTAEQDRAQQLAIATGQAVLIFGGEVWPTTLGYLFLPQAHHAQGRSDGAFGRSQDRAHQQDGGVFPCQCSEDPTKGPSLQESMHNKRM